MWMFTDACCCSWGVNQPDPRLSQIECPSQPLVPHSIDEGPIWLAPSPRSGTIEICSSCIMVAARYNF